MAQSSLGRFDFVTLHGSGDRGQPPPLNTRVAIPLQRPGVDGTAFVRVGIKAQPDWLRSGIDCLNEAHADQLITAYKQLEANGTQNLIWNGVDYGQVYNCGYVVLEVRVERKIRITAAAGGLSSPSTVWLECFWLVHPVIGSP